MQRGRSRTRGGGACTGVAIGAAAVLAGLAAARPPLPPAAGSPPLDALVLWAAWAVAGAAAAWITLTAAALRVVAAARRPRPLWHRIAAGAPSFVRRLAGLALAGTCAVGSAVPAGAAAPSPAGPGLRDEPVVREVGPRAVPDPPGPIPTPTTTPVAPTPRETDPAAASTSAAAPPPAAPVPPATAPGPPAERPRARAAPPTAPAPPARPPAATYVVRAGDNLWVISRRALTTATTAPTEAEIWHYWRAVIEHNRTSLRSGHPGLVYPGELITLPELP